jgi:hypothetical protein
MVTYILGSAIKERKFALVGYFLDPPDRYIEAYSIIVHVNLIFPRFRTGEVEQLLSNPALPQHMSMSSIIVDASKNCMEIVTKHCQL